MLIGELYNQGRCDRHARQLYDSVAGNSGDIFFATCFRQFMIFCAKFYFSAQMATTAIGNANPAQWQIRSDTEIDFVCVEVLWPSQPNGVMSSTVSLPNHRFTGQAYSSKRLTSIVHILSPETDNCPS